MFIFFYMIPRAPSSTLFPYTTLFRSGRREKLARSIEEGAERVRALRGKVEAQRVELGHLVEQSRALGAELSAGRRSEEHTSELQSPYDLVCRLLLEKKKRT